MFGLTETTNYQITFSNEDEIDRHSNSNSKTYMAPATHSDHKKNKVSDPEIDGPVFPVEDHNEEKKVRFGFGHGVADNLKLNIIEDISIPMDSPLGTPLASIAEQHSLKSMGSQDKLEMQLSLYMEREKQWKADKNVFKEEINTLNTQLKALRKELKSKLHVHGDAVEDMASGVEDNNENAPLIKDDDDRQQKGESDDVTSTGADRGNYGCMMCGYRLW